MYYNTGMKKYFPVVFFLLVLNFSILSARETIKVVSFEYPPIYQNLESKGLSCEIVIEAFRAVDIDIDLQFLPVIRMIAAVKNGEAVCGIGGKILFPDSEKDTNVSTSTVVQYVVQTFVYDTRKYPEGIQYQRLQDLSAYKIGALNGSGIMRFIENVPGIQLVLNTIHEGSAKQLYSGRIDLWAIVDLTGLLYLQNLYPKEYMNYNFTKPYNLGDVSVVFSKKMDPYNIYTEKFNKGLSIIKKSGKYMEIMAKYYGGMENINKATLTDDFKKIK